MKKIIILLLINFCYSVKSQTVISSCVAPDSILKKYKGDAARLAIKRTLKINSTYKDSSKVEPVLFTKYLNALIAVYNATALPARDTVVNQYKIHRVLEEINSFEFAADSTLNWMVNIKNNVFPTGYNAFDNLMTKYYLQKAYTYTAGGYGINRFVGLKTDTNYNMPSVAKQFSLGPGIYPYAFPYPDPPFPGSPYLGLQQFIADSVNNSFILLTYTHGWGDCPLGCENQRNWMFKVYNNCSVEYVGSTGQALPIVAIKEQNGLLNNVTLSQNPFTNKLTINFLSDLNLSETSINILNNLGQQVYQLTVQAQKHEMDLSVLSNGIYYLKVKNNDRQKVFKIIKE